MASDIWIGTTDANFDTAGNWASGVVPEDNETLIFNDQATRELTGNIAAADLAALAFAVVVDKGFDHYIGTAGEPFEPADGITSLIFAGNCMTSSHFKAAAAKTIDVVLLDSPSTKDDVLILTGTGSFGQVTVRNGKGKLDGTTVSGRIQVLGAAGGKSELSIPVGNTLTNVEIGVQGGKLVCASDMATAVVSGGELFIDGGADLARLESLGGMTIWDAEDIAAPSTIALAEIFGGTFKIRQDRLGRTLTNANVYANGTLDFSVGGLNVTYTNPLRNYGGMIRMPSGATHTIGV